jgi:hypothetical protein
MSESREKLLGKLLQSLHGQDLNDEENDMLEGDGNYGEEYIAKLQSACSNLLKKESFQVGQLVKWKENLKNRRLPHKNQPAIVVDILDEPIISNEEESGSPYFQENLDIVLGILVEDDIFFTFHYDSRRFEAY